MFFTNTILRSATTFGMLKPMPPRNPCVQKTFGHQPKWDILYMIPGSTLSMIVSNYFISSFSRIQNLEDMLYIYAKNNLVMVNIYIKEPVVTRIWRDEKNTNYSFCGIHWGIVGSLYGILSCFTL